MLPKAVIRITGVRGRRLRISPTISMPVFPGIRISLSTASKSISWGLLDRSPRRIGLVDRVALFLEQGGEHLPHCRIVINQ